MKIAFFVLASALVFNKKVSCRLAGRATSQDFEQQDVPHSAAHRRSLGFLGSGMDLFRTSTAAGANVFRLPWQSAATTAGTAAGAGAQLAVGTPSMASGLATGATRQFLDLAATGFDKGTAGMQSATAQIGNAPIVQAASSQRGAAAPSVPRLYGYSYNPTRRPASPLVQAGSASSPRGVAAAPVPSSSGSFYEPTRGSASNSFLPRSSDYSRTDEDYSSSSGTQVNWQDYRSMWPETLNNMGRTVTNPLSDAARTISQSWSSIFSNAPIGYR
eukprot:GHVU01021145.1.p1 GENE.GHVU01021145.1~~GHVU01021145.1.p1  ORF type:complete len:273 (+),score=19.05 GHVU01021145.1:790-1608(+)